MKKRKNKLSRNLPTANTNRREKDILEETIRKMLKEREEKMNIVLVRETEIPSFVESNIKIYMSKSYQDFSLIRMNRPIDYRRVDKIADRIKAGKNYLQYYPILVNEDMEVTDGQHRLMAAEKTNEYIYFLVAKEMQMEDAAKAVSLTKNWTITDYLHFYAEMGIEDYVAAKRFKEEYDWLPHTFTIGICSSSNYKASTFNNGHFKADRIDFGHKVAKMAEDFRIFSGYKTWPFLNALMNLAANPNYNHKRMMQKMETQQSKLIRCATVEHYLELMSDIYNYRSSPENRVYFMEQYRRKGKK